MAKVTVLCWQEIPSAVEVRDGERAHKIALSPRFMELIDMVAMRRKLVGTDDYLMQWRKDRRGDRSGSAPEVAAAVAAELEARFDEIRAAAIASSSAGPGIA